MTQTQPITIQNPNSWTDKNRKLWLLSLIPSSLLFIAMGLIALFNSFGGQAWSPVFWYYGLFMIFFIIPVLDVFGGESGNNPPDEVIEQLEADRFYRLCNYAFIPLQFAALFLAGYLWSANDLSWLGIDGGLSLFAKIGVLFTVGTAAGIGINAAHELGHKVDNGERWLSKITLAPACYGHFYTEHNRGHHVRVATPEDPASSRFGETFWEFLPRSVFGSLRSAWGIEKKRLARLDKGPWNWRNENLIAWSMSLLLGATMVALFGPEILPFLIGQAIWGFSLLEVVNYLEHYGLLRKRLDNGRYQRPRPEHSWNSDHIVTNIFLYHLQRHSDHHANPTRRYQALRTTKDAPELPFGYATMILVAYIPPLWRKIMDPRVLEHYNGDITQANIHPRKRERILAKYQVQTSPAATGVETSSSTEPTAENCDRVSVRGEYDCPACAYRYREADGNPREGFPAHTPWSAIPEQWSCPDCGVRDKVDFLPVG